MDDELAAWRAKRLAQLMQGPAASPLPSLSSLSSLRELDAYVASHPAVLVDVWAPWCGPCRTMEPLVEELAKEWSGRIAVAKVNADVCPELVARYQIQGIPTFLFFKEGRLATRLVGARPKRDFHGVAASLTS